MQKARKAIILFCGLLLFCCLISGGAKAADISELEWTITICKEQKILAHEMAECARKLGYPESHIIIRTAGQKWTAAHNLQNKTQKLLNAEMEKLSRKRKAYPSATAIYERLKAYGLSDVTTCAILGNVMREVGGDTLVVKPCTYGYSGYGMYYGMCQWSLYYNPSVAGKTLDGQIQYLMKTMPGNMKAFGGSYEYFKSIKDVGTAAIYFNHYYERGTGDALRSSNAVKALRYYTS